MSIFRDCGACATPNQCGREGCAIDRSVREGRITFDNMACDICHKPMLRIEDCDGYGPGWQFDCTCHDEQRN